MIFSFIKFDKALSIINVPSITRANETTVILQPLVYCFYNFNQICLHNHKNQYYSYLAFLLSTFSVLLFSFRVYLRVVFLMKV